MRFLEGDWTWTSEAYFQRWAFQIPFVLYEALILRVFGDVFALYTFNLIFSIIICLLIFLLVKEISGNKIAALISATMFIISPSYIMHEGLLYNNIMGGMLWLVSLYVYVISRKKSSNFGYLLSGVLLAFSQLIRSEAIILMLAIICFSVYELMIESLDLKSKIKIGLNTFVFLGFFCLTLFLASELVKLFGLNDLGVANNCPYWYLICGLSPENYGEYSTQYAYIVEVLDPEKQKILCVQILEEIVGNWNVKSFIEFWAMKMYRMWGADNGPYAYGLSTSTLIQCILFFDKWIYIFTIIFTLSSVKDKSNEKNKILLYIVFIGFFLAFILKEISVKYRYNPSLCLILLSSFGICRLLKNE